MLIPVAMTVITASHATASVVFRSYVIKPHIFMKYQLMHQFVFVTEADQSPTAGLT